MPIIEPVIRPPAEANSFLLQVTTGCSANHCSFCGAYLNKPFRIKNEKEIFLDIEQGREDYPDAKKVFLMDGDALAMKNSQLLPILDRLNDSFCRLSRISSYANGYNITRRTEQELKQLVESKLNLIYIGLESGNQQILDKCDKKSSAQEMLEAVKKADNAGIKSSVIVLLGLGGKEFAAEHEQDTISVLNQMQPRFLSFLSLMLIPGTRLYDEHRSGNFKQLDADELLRQTYNIVSGLELKKTIFRTNHASNYLPLEGRFPQDKQYLMDTLQKAIAGKVSLRPEFFRAL
jgi:radical SAM superfamily enzyme YgiQ (UPF0313 family)